ARQDHVHQDQVRLLAAAHVDAVLGAAGCQYIVPVALQQLVRTAVSVGESSIRRIRAIGALPPGQALTCVRIASRSSSRVNGLVRYCSEPTIRPRALSKRPSFDDSMMTGVLLKIWLFLISAQVW